jgi:beta-lactamase superfamily II metal-dependent hydrolase
MEGDMARVVRKRTLKATKRNLKRKAKKNSDVIRVRMYRVGFGDFFLVTVPSADGDRHILIDCGVTRGKSGRGEINGLKNAVRHMMAEVDGKISLIIATHRHQDHIVGFSRCEDQFRKLEVEAVWLPFWENELDIEVREFQQGLEALAFDIRAAALAGADDDNQDEILGMMENATGLGMSALDGPGGGTNARSLAVLKHGFRGPNNASIDAEYYYKGQVPRLPVSLVETGLSATILGPPKPGAEAFLKLNDLKRGVGQYLGMGGSAGSNVALKLMPFESHFVTTSDAYPSSAFREWVPRLAKGNWDWNARNTKGLESAVRAAVPASLFAAAKKIDGALNNQSLVVLFTWKGKKLLFAGDAQAGNWEYWLHDTEAPVRDPSKLRLSSIGAEILGNLDFYKVGHHGSTNATPISAVEAMGKGFVSMCSTQEDSYGNPTKGTEVPRVPLMDALAAKSTLVRSDHIAIERDDGTRVPAVTGSPKQLPKPKQGKLVVGSCYVDYLL